MNGEDMNNEELDSGMKQCRKMIKVILSKKGITARHPERDNLLNECCIKLLKLMSGYDSLADFEAAFPGGLLWRRLNWDVNDVLKVHLPQKNREVAIETVDLTCAAPEEITNFQMIALVQGLKDKLTTKEWRLVKRLMKDVEEPYLSPWNRMKYRKLLWEKVHKIIYQIEE